MFKLERTAYWVEQRATVVAIIVGRQIGLGLFLYLIFMIQNGIMEQYGTILTVI